MIQFAHYLGLPNVSETAKSLSTKASGAVSRAFTRKPSSVPPTATGLSRGDTAPAAHAPSSFGGSSNSSSIKQAIAAERTRAAEILAAGIKAGQIHTACAFACDTDMTAEQAIAAINAGARDTAAHEGNGRGRRMGLDPDQPTGSTSHRAPTASELAARIVAAGEKAAGRTAPAAASDPGAIRILAAGARARGEA
jgi:hypothetical protein